MKEEAWIDPEPPTISRRSVREWKNCAVSTMERTARARSCHGLLRPDAALAIRCSYFLAHGENPDAGRNSPCIGRDSSERFGAGGLNLCAIISRWPSGVAVAISRIPQSLSVDGCRMIAPRCQKFSMQRIHIVEMQIVEIVMVARLRRR